ncbi:PIN domain-containing protein [Gordonia pseudamarae]|jgi:predicted nucleic acid-binding protein|uniref:Ribonuclease VapC n=1 Tax=Gordonia pseudamarae TaxID=2831662 RepID=A0ABX6IJH2_9ACTN|nr:MULTISPECIES: PIN domain nuclease [Gordonia]MBD0023690.1 PIN domain nuclease [Gordonia sp. (in: high G+C Gram-positive bacteria)]QHN26603.1 PIN domain-containing protein [Gordonia pseudamarae]QHN35496.1 PIN domain-containing protein [Gordonia pseudamarae]
MGDSGRWLIDKSAYARLRLSPDELTWVDRIQRGLVYVATPTLLEIGYSVRSGDEWERFQKHPPVSEMPTALFSERVDSRALEVQGLLARRGHHRAAKVPDLLIAAIAELSDLTVLHADKDFELIADITGQPMERLTGDF